MCLTCWITEKDPRQGSPLRAWTGQSHRERLAKEAFWSPGTRASEKTLIGPYLLRQRQSVSLQTWRHQRPESQAAGTPSHSTHTGAELPQAKKCLVSMRPGSLRSCPALCDPVDCGLPGYSVRERGFSRQEYWSILAKYPLEHCISCCPSCQPPWVPGAARTPATQAAAPSPHLALTGANPNPPGQPQEQTPGSDPHVEVEKKKTTIETQGECGWGRRPQTFPAAAQAAN